MKLSNIQKLWYQPTRHPLLWWLIPFSWLFYGLVHLRRELYRVGIFKSMRLNVPVIVVGNITVGGTGKTPFVIKLANILREHGYQPGIAARGVGGKTHHDSYEVTINSPVTEAGDEALLHAIHAHCPVVLSINRVHAAKHLMSLGCNVIICDDGLQHYALARDIEIAIVDASRKQGNGYLLPAGPLREPINRLQSVDMIVENGVNMTLQPTQFVSISNDANMMPINQMTFKKVHAIAGIGHPDRFFNQLRAMGLEIIPHALPDHYAFTSADISFGDDLPIIMTEKDAVKCKQFNVKNGWFLSVDANVDITIWQQLLVQLKQLEKQYAIQTSVANHGADVNNDDELDRVRKSC